MLVFIVILTFAIRDGVLGSYTSKLFFNYYKHCLVLHLSQCYNKDKFIIQSEIDQNLKRKNFLPSNESPAKKNNNKN